MWLKIFENNWEYFPKYFLQKTSKILGEFCVWGCVSVFRVKFATRIEKEILLKKQNKTKQNKLKQKNKKQKKNAPTNWLDLKGPSARKTWFLSFFFSNVEIKWLTYNISLQIVTETI